MTQSPGLHSRRGTPGINLLPTVPAAPGCGRAGSAAGTPSCTAAQPCYPQAAHLHVCTSAHPHICTPAHPHMRVPEGRVGFGSRSVSGIHLPCSGQHVDRSAVSAAVISSPVWPRLIPPAYMWGHWNWRLYPKKQR